MEAFQREQLREIGAKKLISHCFIRAFAIWKRFSVDNLVTHRVVCGQVSIFGALSGGIPL
jgi:hypothetical protein